MMKLLPFLGCWQPYFNVFYQQRYDIRYYGFALNSIQCIYCVTLPRESLHDIVITLHRGFLCKVYTGVSCTSVITKHMNSYTGITCYDNIIHCRKVLHSSYMYKVHGISRTIICYTIHTPTGDVLYIRNRYTYIMRDMLH